MKKTSQNGIAHLGLLLLILVVVIAFVGYKVKQNSDNKQPLSSSAKSAAQVTTIKSRADLNTVQSQLDNANVDGDLNPASYDSDVSSLN